MSKKVKIETHLFALSDDKILALSKLKAFAVDNFKVIQIAEFSLYRIENIVEKGENTGYQNFLLFPPTMFSKDVTGNKLNQKVSFLRMLSSWSFRGTSWYNSHVQVVSASSGISDQLVLGKNTWY